jgi:hypothetical protein
LLSLSKKLVTLQQYDYFRSVDSKQQIHNIVALNLRILYNGISIMKFKIDKTKAIKPTRFFLGSDRGIAKA